jgi:hypothetical protein
MNFLFFFIIAPILILLHYFQNTPINNNEYVEELLHVHNQVVLTTFKIVLNQTLTNHLLIQRFYNQIDNMIFLSSSHYFDYYFHNTSLSFSPYRIYYPDDMQSFPSKVDHSIYYYLLPKIDYMENLFFEHMNFYFYEYQYEKLKFLTKQQMNELIQHDYNKSEFIQIMEDTINQLSEDLKHDYFYDLDRYYVCTYSFQKESNLCKNPLFHRYNTTNEIFYSFENDNHRNWNNNIEYKDVIIENIDDNIENIDDNIDDIIDQNIEYSDDKIEHINDYIDDFMNLKPKNIYNHNIIMCCNYP